jgi:hypothetical protein
MDMEKGGERKGRKRLRIGINIYVSQYGII